MTISRNKLLIAAVVACGGVAWLSQARNSSSPSNSLTAKVERGALTETVSAIGVIEPSKLVQVGAQVTGQLKSINMQLGAKVKTGDMIAEIDSLQQQNELRLAEASLDEAQATKRSRLIALERAQIVLDRQIMLHKGNATSGADLLDAEAAQKTAKADVDLAQAQIVKATVEVEKAKTNLAYTCILSPIDGTVIALAAEPGQTLNAAQTTPVIAVIANTEVMKIRAQVSEADVGRIVAGQLVRFTTFGDRGTARESILGQIEPAPQSILVSKDVSAQSMNTSSSQAVYYGALIAAPNRDGKLKSSMTANITIVVAQVEDALIVPLQALNGPNLAGEYTAKVNVAKNKIEERMVKIGISDRISAQIISGLAEGEEVIVPITTEPQT